MTQSYGPLPSPAAGLIQLARIKAGLTQRALAQRASVPTTTVSAYERDKRQPTLKMLLKLLNAAGFDLAMRLEPYDPHDEVLERLESGRSPGDRSRRDSQIQAWRNATPAPDLDDVIRSNEAAGRPKDLQVLPGLYRDRASR